MLLSEGRSRQEEYDSRKNAAFVEHRAGSLRISRPALEMRELPEILAILKFVPVRAEFLHLRNAVTLEGYSPFFDKGAPDMIAPKYELEIVADYGRLEQLRIRQEHAGDFKTIYTAP